MAWTLLLTDFLADTEEWGLVYAYLALLQVFSFGGAASVAVIRRYWARSPSEEVAPLRYSTSELLGWMLLVSVVAATGRNARFIEISEFLLDDDGYWLLLVAFGCGLACALVMRGPWTRQWVVRCAACVFAAVTVLGMLWMYGRGPELDATEIFMAPALYCLVFCGSVLVDRGLAACRPTKAQPDEAVVAP
ncbi:MAG: hypothetical protein KDA44_04775 [Planctomycetales bacterium]|nr:hypothetical protein [Planctomycetales bacterium]